MDADGRLVLLADQDRSLWDRGEIAEGLALAAEQARVTPPGPYTLQAAIAAEHARADGGSDTDWARISRLYDWLALIQPSPVVALEPRRRPSQWSKGPSAGSRLIDRIEGLDAYQHLHSARAELLRRAGRDDEALAAYRRALELATNPVERSFLADRVADSSRLARGAATARRSGRSRRA